CSTPILPYPAARSRTSNKGTPGAGSLAAEIGTDHLLMRADVGGGAGGELAAEVEHRDVVADVEDQVRVVLDQQDAGAARGNGGDQLAQAAVLVGRQAGGGL